MRLSDRSATSFKNDRLWSGITAMLLLVTPFMPWVPSPIPGEWPRSLLYLIYTFWQDTLEYMLIRDIIFDSLFTLSVASIWLYALTTLLTLATRHRFQWLRAFGLIISTCFVSWILSTGATGAVWGYWVCCGALLVSWGIEGVRVFRSRRFEDLTMTP